MKKIFNLLTYFVLLILILNSCRKETKIVAKAKNDCPSFKINANPGALIYTTNLRRKSPCFNPNDPNEFVYYYESDSLKRIDLVIYNLETEMETVLLSNCPILGQPKWGKNNIILFSGMDSRIHAYDVVNKLHKILVDIPHCLEPEWISDSEFVSRFSYNIGNPYYILKFNINNNQLDTFKNFALRFPSSNLAGLIAFAPFSGADIHLYDLNFNIIPLTSNVSTGKKDIAGICFNSDGSSIYYTTSFDGIFKIDLDNTPAKEVKPWCEYIMYRYLSISNDNKKIIVERIDRSIIDSLKILEAYNIYIMDIDGKNENKVFK